jgi:hypothetical protein
MLSILALSAATLALNPTADFTVHEWGTFTSFSGPGGGAIPYHVRIAEDLPPFVQARFVGNRWLNADTPEFTKAALHAAQRMETPVIYFHAPREMEVSVEVRFPQGLISEVYPPVTSFLPASLPSPAIPDTGSSVRWDNVRIVPQPRAGTLKLKDAGTSHYAHARNTKGDSVHLSHHGVEHTERFLFYRGVGNPDLKINALALGGGRLILDSGAGPLDTFILENLHGTLRFSFHQGLKPGVEVTIPAKSGSQADLEAAMTSALARAGLHDDEARAMVATWKHHWFAEEGTRMLVVLPQSLIDSVLPLTVSPTPARTTRVFVSRLEVLTPERQAWIETQLKKLAADPNSAEAQEQLESLGRFRLPAVEYARNALLLREGC